MTVDELLANPTTAAELPADAIPLHAILLLEYADPASDTAPERPHITHRADDTLTAWNAIGILRYALQLELDALERHP